MIAETVDLVVHLRLDQHAGTRRVVQVAEVAGLEAGRVLSNDLFRVEDGTSGAHERAAALRRPAR